MQYKYYRMKQVTLHYCQSTINCASTGVLTPTQVGRQADRQAHARTHTRTHTQLQV